MKSFYQSMYRRVRVPEQLPWHREEIPSPLVTATKERKAGRALDLGCGTGVYATFLAEKGFAVTAIDYVPEALNIAQQRAEQKQVTIDFVQADILEWQADSDFIIDIELAL